MGLWLMLKALVAVQLSVALRFGTKFGTAPVQSPVPLVLVLTVTFAGQVTIA